MRGGTVFSSLEDMRRRSLRSVTSGWQGDLLIASIVGGLLVYMTYLVPDDFGTRPLDVGGVLLLLAAAGALAARRRAPVAVLFLTATFGLLYRAAGYPAGVLELPFTIALYTVAVRGRWKLALPAAIAEVAALVAVAAAFSIEPPGGGLLALWSGGLFAAALVIAELTRTRRAYLFEVEQRAREAERAKEEEARRRAGEERLRIARELHDLLAHSLSMINVQAGVAAHLLGRQPEQAEAALLAIKTTSKEALRDLRQTLGILREGDEQASRAPAPSLSLLDELVTRVTAAGELDVALVVTGRPRTLPGTLDQAAYRIIQESLTNVARHADATNATVRVDYRRHDLVVQIDDDGRSPSTGGAIGVGNGITGMRERATAAGGELEAGPRGDRGYRVRARLPTETAA